MRIIFFNIWHGGVWGKLEEFILRQSTKTDIFCFIETDQSLQTKIKKILPSFSCIFDKGTKTNYLGGVYEGRSIFVSSRVVIEKSEKLKLFRTYNKDAGGLITASLSINGKKLTIGCVHGKARPGTKLDTPIRIKQSEIIINKFKHVSGPIIIGGDFNLNPETKSIKMIEEAGYKNLIKEFNIKDTRGEINHRNFLENDRQYFADYCFTSSDIKVSDFEVPQTAASDHEPQILDFEI